VNCWLPPCRLAGQDDLEGFRELVAGQACGGGVGRDPFAQPFLKGVGVFGLAAV